MPRKEAEHHEPRDGWAFGTGNGQQGRDGGVGDLVVPVVRRTKEDGQQQLRVTRSIALD
jgi:hypothetical protein